MDTLDARPLLDTIEARGGIRRVLGLPPADAALGREFGRRPDRTKDDVARWLRAHHRMRASGEVSVWQADRFCVRLLGTLPCLVYGAEWWDAIPDEGEVA